VSPLFTYGDVVVCIMGGLLENAINKGGGWGGENSSSKALGVSVPDRPKAKIYGCRFGCLCTGQPVLKKLFATMAAATRGKLSVRLALIRLC
jgi:hypothetical protein